MNSPHKKQQFRFQPTLTTLLFLMAAIAAWLAYGQESRNLTRLKLKVEKSEQLSSKLESFLKRAHEIEADF